MVRSKFPCLQLGSRALWPLGVQFLKRMLCSHGFSKGARTKQGKVCVPPPFVNVTLCPRGGSRFGAGSSPSCSGAVNECQGSVRLGHSANESFTGSCVTCSLIIVGGTERETVNRGTSSILRTR